jgi:YNFM family putative membrane transporter
MSMFLVLAACGFASSFSLRLIDPVILPVATHFGVATGTAAMLSPAYALPYALSQPFLGPISDRFGRMQCMNVCMAGLAATLLLSALAPSFELLFASRMAAGVFGGGLIPLVLAALGDAYDMQGRQVAIGRMLFALISGQMLGSVVAGFAAQAAGWR